MTNGTDLDRLGNGVRRWGARSATDLGLEQGVDESGFAQSCLTCSARNKLIR